MNIGIETVIDYIKSMLSINLNLESALSMIATDGLVAYLIYRRIRGYGYRIKTALIMAFLLGVILLLIFINIVGLNAKEMMEKFFN